MNVKKTKIQMKRTPTNLLFYRQFTNCRFLFDFLNLQYLHSASKFLY